MVGWEKGKTDLLNIPGAALGVDEFWCVEYGDEDDDDDEDDEDEDEVEGKLSFLVPLTSSDGPLSLLTIELSFKHKSSSGRSSIIGCTSERTTKKNKIWLNWCLTEVS